MITLSPLPRNIPQNNTGAQIGDSKFDIQIYRETALLKNHNATVRKNTIQAMSNCVEFELFKTVTPRPILAQRWG